MDGREHEGRCQELPGGEGPGRDLQAVQCPGGDIATEGDWCSGDGLPVRTTHGVYGGARGLAK